MKIKYAIRIMHNEETIAVYVLHCDEALTCIRDIWKKYVMPDPSLILKIDTIIYYEEQEEKEDILIDTSTV